VLFFLSPTNELLLKRERKRKRKVNSQTQKPK